MNNNVVLAYWIGYSGSGRARRAAFYYANLDTSANQVNGTRRHGWFAIPRVRWHVRRHVKLVAGIPIEVRDMRGLF